MILYVKGNLLQSPAQVLVNTVNTFGAMGKGIALEFKRLYPEMYKEYRRLCEQGQFEIGNLWLYKSPNKWVLNFPTKKHWRYPSKLSYIEAGLEKFIESYTDLDIHSIAFPPLGCGNGQLDFEFQVKPLMEKYLRNLPIDVFIHPDRESEFIEHLHQESMRKWLSSEPTSLPFNEVWEDLASLLINAPTFTTIARKSPFTAEVSSKPEGIRVHASSTNYLIPLETLIAFWQQLRTYGFSMRKIAPDVNREVSYLIPIFASLDYIMPVHVADDYQYLKNTAATGLQILPAAFRHAEVTQPPLFEMEF